MIKVEIPGFGKGYLERLVSEITGTLSVDGKLFPGVKERLRELSRKIEIHILTADTFGSARNELEDINCKILILDGKNQDL